MEKERGKQPIEGDDSGSKRSANQRTQEMAAPRPRDASYPPLPNSFPAPTPNPVSYAGRPSSNARTSKIISIPNVTVGAVIGKGGQRINCCQRRSGARIKVTEDQYAGGRAVRLTGTPEQIDRAEQLIRITAQRELQDPHSSAAHGYEEIEMTVPINKVGLLIGKGGENARSIEFRTGAVVHVDNVIICFQNKTS